MSCVVSHQVILQKCEVESMVHSPGDYILLSADKYEIKVMLLSPVSFVFHFQRVKKLTNLELLSLFWCEPLSH